MQTNNAFISSKIRKIGENLSAQTAKVLKSYSAEIDTRALPILSYLYAKGNASISELGDQIGFTHPAIIQLVSKLEKEKFVTINKSTSDKRITILELTSKGKDAFKNIEPVIADLDEIIESIINDIDPNLSFALLQLDKSLKDGLLLKRMNEKLKQQAINEAVIVPYKKKYKSDFKRLNEEWLNKYFVIEDEDKRQLANPEREITGKGGEVFFALLNEEVVGTCAMIKVDDSTYELAKMAVTEKARGKQIGKKLMLTSIGFAVENNAKKVILSTSPKLEAAINLYRSVGFKRTKTSYPSSYKRELFMMELDLTAE